MGRTVSEWFEKPSLDAEWIVSPHIKATEAMSDEVSMAIIVDIPVLYLEVTGWRIFRFYRFAAKPYSLVSGVSDKYILPE